MGFRKPIAQNPSDAPSRLQKSRVTDVDRAIGRRIRDRRIALGLTQQQVAGMLGVTYQQAHKYETGANRVSAGRLHQLARVLGVDVGYFYEGLGSGEPARPSAGQRQMLELARSFVVLARPQQEALCELVRTLASVEEAATTA